jgi:hexosaminidase
VGRWISITANTTAGAFYGTRTLLQLFAQKRTIDAGVARDWPRYEERGLMVDIGRKYFTRGWLEARIREMALLKLNYLHLHLSDDQGFRLQSTSHPEIVSTQHLTKNDMRAIVGLATRDHITVVPEIDMPAHMGAELGPHPELQLTDITRQRQAGKLDVTLPAAQAFVKSLIEEYLPLFPGRYWDMGADEFIGIAGIGSPLLFLQFPQLQKYAQAHYGSSANGEDAILGFVNWVDDLVRAHGRTMRMWNDGLAGGSAVKAHPDIVVDWWTNGGDSPSPAAVLGQGHRISNSGWYPTYYVNSAVTGTIPPRPDMASAYTSWSVDQFFGEFYLDPTARLGPPPYRLAPGEPRNLGAELNVWNDDPNYATQDQIATAIAPRLRLIAQKTWDSPPLTSSYASFEKIVRAPLEIHEKRLSRASACGNLIA